MSAVELSSVGYHRADHVFGDVRSVDARRVGHGDTVVFEGVPREVSGAGEDAREQFEILSGRQLLLVDIEPDGDPSGFEQLALLGWRSSQRDRRVRESIADRGGEIRRVRAVDRLSQHDDVWVAHGGTLAAIYKKGVRPAGADLNARAGKNSAIRCRDER